MRKTTSENLMDDKNCGKCEMGMISKEAGCPKLSIITASFNRAKTLERSIQSVLSQGYPNVEFIIIDGGSTDGTMEIIRKYEDLLSYWVSEPDKGIADAWNKGIARSTGEVISMVNADDWYEPGVFKRIAESFQERPDVDIIHGNVRYWQHSQNLYIKRPFLKKGMIWRLMPYLFPSCFIRKSLYDSYGVFDTSYKVCMDYELMLRFFKEDKQFLYIDEVLANFELGGLSDVSCIPGLMENKDIAIRHGYSTAKSYLNLWYFVARRGFKATFERAHLGFLVNIARKNSGQWSFD